MTLTTSNELIWAIAVLATAGVILRPFHLPEALWAVLGAAALVGLGLLPWQDAGTAIGRGSDVYLFLTGMMLLSEVARREGLFDHVAARAAGLAHGSANRLFVLVYGVGVVVTVFLSNDATAVVLTPAVYAAARAAKAEPLPYLLVCAFIANAASFVLPISNPANLVLFGSGMPPLLDWLARFSLPSALAIAATYAALWFTQRKALKQTLATDIVIPALSAAGRGAAIGIVLTAIVLVAASAADVALGPPTFITGAATTAIVLLRKREAPWGTLRGVSWSVLPLVAGLFVLVEGVSRTGAVAALGRHLAPAGPFLAGLGFAVASNLMNNLPAGLIAASTVASAHLPHPVTDGLMVGVDLGPNLSVTGSLATILWLVALKREGVQVTAWQFLKIGAVVTPPALLLALGALMLH